MEYKLSFLFIFIKERGHIRFYYFYSSFYIKFLDIKIKCSEINPSKLILSLFQF